jgi:putative flippase GtrA
MIKKMIFAKAEHIHIQLTRFLFVGTLSFLIDFSILWFCTDILKIYYIISATIAFIFSVIINYLLSTFWVFHKSKLDSKLNEFGIFVLLSGVGLILNDVFLYVFTDFFHVYYLFSKVIATGIVMFWNFISRKKILFH